MALFSRNLETPAWLDQTRESCRSVGMNIAAWGPHAPVVEAKSSERAAEIANHLAHFGSEPVQDENYAYAGLLTRSHPD
jgi:hypothetical protein